jgi:hypothetical protein
VQTRERPPPARCPWQCNWKRARKTSTRQSQRDLSCCSNPLAHLHWAAS